MVVPWTEQEIETLISLKNSGKSHREIAKILGRSKKSVESKARELRIRNMLNSSNESSTKDNASKVNTYKENTISRNNKEKSKEVVIVYKKFLKNFFQKDNMSDNEFYALTDVVDEYYTKTKNLQGAILLLETIMKSGR